MTITITRGEDEIALDVDFRTYGKYRPATHTSPEEYPELEITSITDEQGNKFEVTPTEWRFIKNKIEDYKEDY